MRKRNLKGLLIAAACSLGAFGIPQTTYAAEDILLNDADSGFVKEYQPGDGSGYKYMGYVYCFEAPAEYKYLQITYTGDATAFDELRLEFVVNSDPSEEIKLPPCWFRQNDEGTIYTVDGTEVPAPNEEEQTVVIDLEKSGLDLTTGIRAFHVHDTQGLGGFTIKEAKLMTTPSGSQDTVIEENEEDDKEDESQAESQVVEKEESTKTNNSINIPLVVGFIIGGCVVAIVASFIAKKMNY